MKEPVLIMGGGHQGLSMAAHLALNGERVYLWNRTPENIAAVSLSRQVVCKGVVEGVAGIERVSSDIAGMVTRRIMITTTAMAHRPLARLLAPHLPEGAVVVLNPGRTFGAEEFRDELRLAGCKHMPTIAETQTIVYTCRRDAADGVYIYALKRDVGIACPEGHDVERVFEALPDALREYFIPSPSTIVTSLGNVGMILHCAPMIMNIGWIEHPSVSFNYYYEGISRRIAMFLEKLDDERLSVAKAMGYNIESVADWMRRVYNVTGDNLHQCLSNNASYRTIEAPKTMHHRYIEDDIPYGLVPLESAACHYGVPVPLTRNIIDLANAVMNVDYRATGRLYGCSC